MSVEGDVGYQREHPLVFVLKDLLAAEVGRGVWTCLVADHSVDDRVFAWNLAEEGDYRRTLRRECGSRSR